MKVELATGYSPHAKQLDVHSCEKRFVVIAAGVRGGKTYSASVEFVRRIYADLAAGKGKESTGIGKRRQPRLLYWVVAPTAALAKVTVRYLLELVPRELLERVYEAENSIWLRPDILIEIKTAERPDLLVASSVNGMLIDEACRVKAEAWRGSLRGRLTDSKGWAIFATSPLGGRNSWVFQELVTKAGADEEIASVGWTTADNPHIARSEIEAAKRQLPDAWFKRDYLASWDSFGGAIYPEFDAATHVVSEKEFRLQYGVRDRNLGGLFRRTVAGVDFGYSSPGAIVVIGHIGDNSFAVLDESYAPARPILGTGTTWLSEARRLKERWGISMFVCDPARPDAIVDLQTNGIPCVGAFNDIYLGIRRVAEALHPGDGRPGMRVFDSCQNLVREIRNYTWRPTKGGGGFTEVPDDGQSDHALDALRYATVELRPYSVAGGVSRQHGRPIG